MTASVLSLFTDTGRPLAGVTTRYYYSTSPLILYGHQTDLYPSPIDGGENARYVYDAQLPVTALVGSSGAFIHYTATSTVTFRVVRRGVVAWSLEPFGPSGDHAWLCLNTTVTDAATGTATTEKHCYLFDTSGKLTGNVRYSTSVGGQPFNCPP